MSSSTSTADRPRKRPVTSLQAVVDYNDDEPPLRRARRDVLSCELETFQGELEHERILRGLDCKRFQQTKARLEKQVEFAVEEAREAKALMEEMRQENERHVDQLKRARTRAQEELRDVQAELEDLRVSKASEGLMEDPRIEKFKDAVEARVAENKALKETIEELQGELKRILERESSFKEIAPDPEALTSNAASEARPEVLQELNKVRVALAESERKNRQYKRAAEDAQRKAKQLVQEREMARSATKRVDQLEAKLTDATQKGATLSVELNAWKEFGAVVAKQVFSGQSSICLDPSVPPELSLLNQYWNDAKAKANESEAEKISLKRQLEQSRETVQKMDVQSRDFNRKEAAWKQDYQNLEKKMELAQMDIKLLKRQENVYKREVESLRSIVKTFDELPLGSSQHSARKVNSVSSSKVGLLEAALTAAQEEIKIVKEGQESVQKEMEVALSEKDELQQTHNAFLEKFGKLKEALFAERAKAAKAEERANEAEVLAGKGSFNPDETRVLHLSNNPLNAALKDEIRVLRKQVEVLSGGDKNKLSAPDVDPNKLHQRLKQSFKEQIGRFREGVYMMTGFKVRTDVRHFWTI